MANGVRDCAAGPMWRAGREGEEAEISVLTEDYMSPQGHSAASLFHRVKGQQAWVPKTTELE